MLQTIRDRIQGWIFSLIIILLVIAFAFWGIERFFTGRQTQQVIAKVDNRAITQNEFNNTYQRLRRQLQLETGDNFQLTPQIEKNLKQQALHQLLYSYVLRKNALAMGFRVNGQQIDAVLAGIPIFQENGQFSAQKFQMVLNNLFYNENDFIQQLHTEMLVNQLQEGLLASSFALPNEIDNAYKLFQEQRDFIYTVIPLTRFTPKIKIDSKVARNYYEQNKDQFRKPEEVQVQYLELSLNDLAARQKVSEAELKKYYDTHQQNFTIPARYRIAHILIDMPQDAKVDAIQKQLKKGTPFTKVAAQYSDDVVSRDKGGILPWLSEGTKNSLVLKAKLLKTGEVSKPFRDQYGINIIKLLAKKPKQVLPYAKVKNQVSQQLKQEKAQKIFAEQSEQLANLTFSDSGSLKTAANALGLPIKTTDYFSRQDNKLGIAQLGIASNPRVVNAAFSDTVLGQNYNSDPIPLDDNSIVVLHLLNHKPETTKTFNEVRPQIEAIIVQKNAEAQAKGLGQKIVLQLNQGKNFTVVTKQYGLKVYEGKDLKRHDTLVDSFILNAAFSMPKPKVNQTTIQGVTLPSGDFIVIQLTAVKAGNTSSMKSTDKESYQKTLSANEGQLAYQLFVQQAMQAANIKTNLQEG